MNSLISNPREFRLLWDVPTHKGCREWIPVQTQQGITVLAPAGLYIHEDVVEVIASRVTKLEKEIIQVRKKLYRETVLDEWNFMGVIEPDHGTFSKGLKHVETRVSFEPIVLNSEENKD